ncbi:factor VIII intron 22 protein [Galendromus occidentalis]|uniref:Factor VIII intron 22 protein n=1 Tax=Galendromus occidentalis TaxID=34638 RepID=A0AAJ6QZ03_9ACAR|nr:factor VIII intron 22 protein [Galendromus occidentalis]
MESRRSSTATMAPAGDEFLRSMAQIRDKLRKRFLRKPLYLEAAHSYEALAARQHQLEFPEAAAMSHNAAGDVYSDIKRLGPAADNYTKAARTYMKEELELKKLCMPSIEDNLINALECYHRAISTYGKIAENNKGSSGMVASLCYEAGTKLQRLERFGESTWFLEKAVRNWPESPALKVECLMALASSQVNLSEFESAENTFHDASALVLPHLQHNSFEETHQLIQISLVLLIAYLAPPQHNLTPAQKMIMERFQQETDDSLEIDVFLTLKAILECCRERCFEKMSQHYDTLINFCEETQRIIFDELIRNVCPYHRC